MTAYGKGVFNIIKNEEACKGVIFRLRENAYYNSKIDQYMYGYRLTLQKRKSCKDENCLKQCGWFLVDQIQDFIDVKRLPIITDVEDGALYKLIVVNEQRDWESGMVDDWELEFIKL